MIVDGSYVDDPCWYDRELCGNSAVVVGCSGGLETGPFVGAF
jgi:hypothetical protein